MCKDQMVFDWHNNWQSCFITRMAYWHGSGKDSNYVTQTTNLHNQIDPFLQAEYVPPLIGDYRNHYERKKNIVEIQRQINTYQERQGVHEHNFRVDGYRYQRRQR